MQRKLFSCEQLVALHALDAGCKVQDLLVFLVSLHCFFELVLLGLHRNDLAEQVFVRSLEVFVLLFVLVVIWQFSCRHLLLKRLHHKAKLMFNTRHWLLCLHCFCLSQLLLE
jgi:hypothetical protein